ncbi:hypothetical protein Tco_1540241 [Tanacetum coccineum]
MEVVQSYYTPAARGVIPTMEVSTKFAISPKARVVLLSPLGSRLSANSQVGNGVGGLEEVTFLYKLTLGACPKSYGVNVARLTGTDISEITRKPSKTSKHGHENGRVNKSRKPKPEKVKSTVNTNIQTVAIIILATTYASPTFTHMAGMISTWKALSPKALQASFNVTPEVTKVRPVTKCVAVEFARKKDPVICILFLPGTVDTYLSKPFQKNVPKDKLFTKEFSVFYTLQNTS